MDREDRARGAVSALPAQVLESILDGLELHTGRCLRRLHAVLGNRIVREELTRVGDAAHEQARGAFGLETFADDDLGAAAANVHGEPSLVFIGERVRDA